MVFYLLTISCQQKTDFIQKYQLDEVCLWLKMNIASLHIQPHVYETSGKYNQLHYHALVSVDKYFYYRPFTAYGEKNKTISTFRIQWSKVDNLSGALQYLRKDLWHASQGEILIRNFYKYNYFNMDTQQFTRL